MTDEELDEQLKVLQLAAGNLIYLPPHLTRKVSAALTTLRAQLAEAHTRIEAMESGDWSEVKLVRFENGQMDISAGPIPAIAEYLAQMMQDGDGKYFNFMEVSINHNIAGPMTLSLQRKNGKTPNQLRKEAEARADRAEAALAAQIEVDAGICDGMQSSTMYYEAHECANAIRNQPHDRTALDRMLAEAKAEALQGPWSDKPDDLTQETINAAMPFKVRDDYKIYCRALELVSNRHSKGALVGLVNYLLRQSDEAREKALREAADMFDADSNIAQTILALIDATNSGVTPEITSADHP